MDCLYCNLLFGIKFVTSKLHLGEYYLLDVPQELKWNVLAGQGFPSPTLEVSQFIIFHVPVTFFRLASVRPYEPA